MRSVLNRIGRYLERITTPRITNNVVANVVSLSKNNLLDGRSAFITGGTSGIGLSIAKAFLNAGANVVIAGRSSSKWMSVKQSIVSEYPEFVERIHFIQLDLSLSNDYDKVVADILTLTPKFDILVNNAVTLGCQFGTGSEEEFDKVLNTNLRGAFMLSQAVARYFVSQGIKGNILNICSSSSFRPAASAYTLSKWGIRGLTLGMAKSLIGKGIVVNGIAPGPTATPMLLAEGQKNIDLPTNPLGRYTMPEEIANMAVILVSDLGRTIVGAIVPMTGGAGVITFDDIKYGF